jgi:hypothetical protein
VTQGCHAGVKVSACRIRTISKDSNQWRSRFEHSIEEQPPIGRPATLQIWITLSSFYRNKSYSRSMTTVIRFHEDLDPLEIVRPSTRAFRQLLVRIRPAPNGNNSVRNMNHAFENSTTLSESTFNNDSARLWYMVVIVVIFMILCGLLMMIDIITIRNKQQHERDDEDTIDTTTSLEDATSA